MDSVNSSFVTPMIQREKNDFSESDWCGRKSLETGVQRALVCEGHLLVMGTIQAILAEI